MTTLRGLPELSENNGTIVSNIKKTTPAIIVGSLIFVCGLIWNDTIREIINHYVPEDQKNSKNILYKILYSLIVTFIIIVVISVIMKYAPR